MRTTARAKLLRKSPLIKGESHFHALWAANPLPRRGGRRQPCGVGFSVRTRPPRGVKKFAGERGRSSVLDRLRFSKGGFEGVNVRLARMGLAVTSSAGLTIKDDSSLAG